MSVTGRGPAVLVGIDTEADDQWSARGRQAGEVRNAERLPALQALCDRYGVRPTYVVTWEMATPGRSRNDQVGVDMRLYVRRRIPDVQRSLTAVIDALVAQAVSAGDAVMPSYTQVRRAQPVTVAHYLLAHAAALRRDVERFSVVRAEADAMPLGAGAIAGTNYASTRPSWPRSWASRGSWPTASTRPPTATTSAASCTRLRWPWST